MPSLDRSVLERLPTFRRMAGEDIDMLLKDAHPSRFSKNSEIFSQGEEARSFFLLVSGHVRVVRTSAQGDKVIVRHINEGELMGIAIAMERAVYPASAIAIVECLVLNWPNSAWPSLKSKVPGFGTAVYRTIGQRFQETHDRVLEMASEQVEQRVARAMLRLMNEAGRQTADGMEIDFPITRQEIAEMAGTTLHMVSRLLSVWKDQGLVRGARQKIVISNPHGLMRVAERHRDE